MSLEAAERMGRKAMDAESVLANPDLGHITHGQYRRWRKGPGAPVPWHRLDADMLRIRDQLESFVSRYDDPKLVDWLRAANDEQLFLVYEEISDALRFDHGDGMRIGEMRV